MALELKNINFKKNSAWNNLLDLTFPLEYCYVTFGDEKPSLIYGGIWEVYSSNSTPHLLTACTVTASLGNIVSGDYNYSWKPVITDKGVGVNANQIARRWPSTSITSGSSNLSHYHDNTATLKRLRGCSTYSWTKITPVTGNVRIIASSTNAGILCWDSTTTTNLTHNHNINVDYATSQTYSGTHSHTFTGTTATYNSQIPLYKKVNVWKRVG